MPTHVKYQATHIYIHDFLTSSDNEAYRIRYEAGAKLGWRSGNFQVNDTRGHRLFIAHHHSSAEVTSIRARFENLNYRRHDSLSMNGNACRMFEFLGLRRTEDRGYIESAGRTP